MTWKKCQVEEVKETVGAGVGNVYHWNGDKQEGNDALHEILYVKNSCRTVVSTRRVTTHSVECVVALLLPKILVIKNS